MQKVLVFVSMKYKADRVARDLQRGGVSSAAIHGNKSQNQRTWALRDFKNGKVRVLVATDIAARGIDVKDIGHIINYDLPNEPENYIHRIGRTARAGKGGTAYSFCSAEDRNFLNQIERTMKRKIEHADHKYHSTAAKSAEGKDAKPRPRRNEGSRGRGGANNRSRSSPRGRSDGRPSPRGRNKSSSGGRSDGRSRSGSSSGRSRPRR